MSKILNYCKLKSAKSIFLQEDIWSNIIKSILTRKYSFYTTFENFQTSMNVSWLMISIKFCLLNPFDSSCQNLLWKQKKRKSELKINYCFLSNKPICSNDRKFQTSKWWRRTKISPCHQWLFKINLSCNSLQV